jgi:hypothetical protein
MFSDLIGKTVKVYKDVNTKNFYEGDGVIKEVSRKISDTIYVVNCAFSDDYFTCIIDINDILF